MSRIALGIVLFENSENELERLSGSVELALRPFAPGECEVLWWDNSQRPKLKKTVGRRRPADHYTHSTSNLGFGAGHNALMRRAFANGADHYVCVNPDAVLHPLCARELVREAEGRPCVGLVEARLVPEEHRKRYSRRTHRTSWCSGTVLLVTRAAFEATGGFDEQIFMYCEDVDLSWRVRAAGLETLIAPKALAYHYVEERPYSAQRERMGRTSAAYLGLKYGHPAFSRKQSRILAGLGMTPPAIPSPDGRFRAPWDGFHFDLIFTELRW